MDAKDILMLILYFAVLIYDAMFVWVKVAFGIATGLLIPNRIVGLLACAAGNAAWFMYTRGGDPIGSLWFDWVLVIFWCIYSFAGLVWWVVGRVLRRIYLWLKTPNGSGATT